MNDRSQTILLIDKIQDVLEGQKMEHVMAALCTLVGYAGADNFSDMRKQEYIANVVNDISEAYDAAKERTQNG